MGPRLRQTEGLVTGRVVFIVEYASMEAASEIYTACIFADNFTSLALSSHNWR